MEHRRRHAIAFLITCLSLTVTGCAPSVGPGSNPDDGFSTLHTIARGDVVAPDRIDTLRRVRIHSFPEPRLGHMVTYRDDAFPDTRIDVYVYPISLHVNGTLAHSLSNEARSILDGMELVARREGLKYGPPGFSSLGPPDEDGGRGILIERSLYGTDGALANARSFGYVSVKDHVVFKVRMTGGFRGDPAAINHVVDLIEALHANVGIREGVFPAPGFDVVPAPGLASDPCERAGWIAYGGALRSALAAGRYLDTYAREHRARAEALRRWREHARSSAREGEPCGESPFRSVDRIEKAGLFDEYVFAAFGQPWWSPPHDLDQDAFERWIAENHDGHDPTRFPDLLIKWKLAGDPPAPADSDASRARIDR